MYVVVLWTQFLYLSGKTMLGNLKDLFQLCYFLMVSPLVTHCQRLPVTYCGGLLREGCLRGALGVEQVLPAAAGRML